MSDLFFPKKTEKEGVNHLEVTGTLLHGVAATYQWLRVQGNVR